MKTYKKPIIRVHQVNIEPLLTQSWNPGKGEGGYTHPEKPGKNNYEEENLLS